VDADEGLLARDPASAEQPGARSQYLFGERVGLELILDALARLDVPATFFVPGRVAERFPERVAEVVAAGHELAHHGYTHRPVTALSRDEEEAELVRGLEALGAFGAPVVGYRSPSWELTDASLELLGAHGLRYSSNFMDDVRPYVHPGGIVELPVQWILDDAPYFMFSRADWTRRIAPPREVREHWQDELGAIFDLGGLGVLTMHPHLIGRPSRVRMLEDVIRWAKERDGLWIARCGEIAAYAAG
jgi:peptidoglycan/xylan/chitin deacetylase (PgdA/CDA1 family)